MADNRTQAARLAAKNKKRPNRLRELRFTFGLKLRDVADRVGIHLGTLSQFELGDSVPSLGVAKRLARFYGEPVESIWPETAADTKASV